MAHIIFKRHKNGNITYGVRLAKERNITKRFSSQEEAYNYVLERGEKVEGVKSKALVAQAEKKMYDYELIIEKLTLIEAILTKLSKIKEL